MALPSWPFVILSLFLLAVFSSVQGLKCYVCDTEVCSSPRWNSRTMDFLKYAKPYLLECNQGAVSCASFYVTTKDPYYSEDERWFQRICLYPDDLTCMGWNPQDFPSTWPKPEHEFEQTDVIFPDWVTCINSNRKKNSIPEIKEIPSDSLIQIRGRPVLIKFNACKENITDGCNGWDGFFRRRTPVSLAEGFPMDVHEQRKKGYSSNFFSAPLSPSTEVRELEYFGESKVFGCGV